MTIKDVLISIL